MRVLVWLDRVTEGRPHKLGRLYRQRQSEPARIPHELLVEEPYVAIQSIELLVCLPATSCPRLRVTLQARYLVCG